MNRESRPEGARELDPDDQETSRLSAAPGGSTHSELARLLRRGSLLLEQIRQEDRARRRAQEEQERLDAELEATRGEAEEIVEILAKLDRRSTQLTRLYVATHQLYLGRTPERVYETIAEITTDILGAERYALLVRDGDDTSCRIVLRQGIETDSDDLFGRELYSGGHEEVDRVLTSGVRWLHPDAGPPVAVVPLRVDETILGVLVIFDLLEHKPMLDDSDSELLDLLGAHAASALLSSINLSITARKLQTMTRLFQLVIEDSQEQ